MVFRGLCVYAKIVKIAADETVENHWTKVDSLFHAKTKKTNSKRLVELKIVFLLFTPPYVTLSTEKDEVLKNVGKQTILASTLN